MLVQFLPIDWLARLGCDFANRSRWSVGVVADDFSIARRSFCSSTVRRDALPRALASL